MGLVLEGGYDLIGLEGSVAASAKALLDPKAPLPEGRSAPASSIALRHTIEALGGHWPALLPK